MSTSIWIAIALMLMGAAMLLAGLGAAGLWIAVIAAGIGLVAIDTSQRHGHI